MSFSSGCSLPQPCARQLSRPPLSCSDRRARCWCSASSEATTNGAAASSSGDYVQLGASPLTVSAVGVGTLAWGDPGQVGTSSEPCTSQWLHLSASGNTERQIDVLICCTKGSCLGFLRLLAATVPYTIGGQGSGHYRAVSQELECN